MLSSTFVLASLIVALVPGTGTLYTISTGLFQGWRASIAAAIGCTAGIIPHVVATILGLSLVLHTGALVFQALKVAGAIYLLYLAWAMWRDQGSLAFDRQAPSRGPWRIIVKAIALNILNPKLTLFFFAFLPLFLSPNAASPMGELLVLSAAFMGITLIVFVAYGLLASSLRAYVVRSPQALVVMRRLFAAVFALLAVQLAVGER